MNLNCSLYTRDQFILLCLHLIEVYNHYWLYIVSFTAFNGLFIGLRFALLFILLKQNQMNQSLYFDFLIMLFAGEHNIVTSAIDITFHMSCDKYSYQAIYINIYNRFSIESICKRVLELDLNCWGFFVFRLVVVIETKINVFGSNIQMPKF